MVVEKHLTVNLYANPDRLRNFWECSINML